MKTWKLLMLAATALLASCSSTESEEPSTANDQQVTLTFSPYEITPLSTRSAGDSRFSREVSTRAATSIASIATRLDIWLIEGENTTAIHQTSADADFGSVLVTLDKTKTYKLYAMGHKSAEVATLADGVISFSEDKIKESMFYSTTFSPSSTTSLSCLMHRIVAQFRFETTDAVPAECKKMRFTISDVWNRWNVLTGASNQSDRVSTINITSTNDDGTAIFNIYAIVQDTETLHSVTVEALDAEDNAVQTPRTFADVPLRNGYRTTYRGTYFTDTPTTATFTIADWNAYDPVIF